SWRGWLILVFTLALSVALLILGIYPFLSVTHRAETKTLIVEGWVHPYSLRAAAKEFAEGKYQKVFTTGGPVKGTGGYTSDSQTSASVAAGGLRAAGIPGDLLQMVPSRVNERDRTYSSAIALQRWFSDHNFPVTAINVMTEDLHARRTRLLFEKAFGSKVEIGIIAIPNPDYDAKHWWRYSEGVRDLIGETIAYIYARFFFFPSEQT